MKRIYLPEPKAIQSFKDGFFKIFGFSFEVFHKFTLDLYEIQRRKDMAQHKVWLDDVRPPRDNTFTYWAKTAEEVWDLLQAGEVWFISFDHDLGDDQKYNGYDLACWIEKAYAMGDFKDKIFWDVHSQNPVGAKRITEAMTSYTIMERTRTAKITAEEGVLE